MSTKQSSSSSSSSSWEEVECIGELQIVKENHDFIGTIPISYSNNSSSPNSALIVPSSHPAPPPPEGAPMYRVIPTETNLKTLPVIRPTDDNKVLPIVAAAAAANTRDLPNESGTMASNLRRKGEALAVSGLTEYGEDIDVIAPADILKQIFKIPYSRARLSIAVHRIGQSLILNTGPDVEEGEKLARRHKQSQSTEKSIFRNFAMHSVRMEACDCPTPQTSDSDKQVNSTYLPGNRDSDTMVNGGQGEGFNPQSKQDSFYWGKKKKQRNKDDDAVKEVSKVKENPRPSMQESDMYRRMNRDGFLRVLFWKFNNLRMFLGSDLLIFSNEKYVAVSLHLWDVSRQVTPLTWLEAWLDNMMASVPELAICYHQNGVVQGYELLKTDNIFHSKGLSEDGTPFFYPEIVREHGHSVLRFLQENCKQDPGAYWLYKNAGEDNIQLFDLSVVPKSHATNSCDDDYTFRPSLINRGRSDSLLSLGTLLYRSPHNRARCAMFLKKCLDFLDQPDQLVVRAFAHEQFARLLLDYDEDLDLTSEVLPLDSEDIVVDAEESESDKCFNENSELIIHDNFISNKENESGGDTASENSVPDGSLNLLVANEAESGDAVMQLPTCNAVVQANVDLISSKLAAIHHVSQAIKSLRWTRQLQSSETHGKSDHGAPLPVDFSVCACGDADCIEVCDIRKWLPKSKLDDKLWKLLLLLGESYLALGEAYIQDGQSHQSFKVVRLACLVYGSMPQLLEGSRFISSMSSSSSSIEMDDIHDTKSIAAHYLFWAKAWTLVGDVYVEFHIENQKVKTEEKPPARELKMSPEVQKELDRLKEKLGKFNQSCSSCSLVNCSCQSDRASSGSSASSSSRTTRSLSYGKKHSEKAVSKSLLQNVVKDNEVVISSSKETDSDSSETNTNNGGIFRYLDDYEHKDADHNLTTALDCYKEAAKCLEGDLSNSVELHSLYKKKGWVCNELGRKRLERKETDKAEQAFSEAISSFKKVSDHNNIILINCNLGHGRRAAAEEMVSQMEHLRNHPVFSNACNQKLEAAKSKYCESLKFYRAAKKEADANDVISDLRNEVSTQFAHTYLRLGMFLARENTTAKAYKSKMEFGKREISANDAISEALSIYESLGDLRKQEAAYAYFQIACYQRDCCLRLLEMDVKKSKLLKGENSVPQRVKQHLSIAERNWQKSMQFYGPKTHSTMYLTILIERAALLCSLSKSSHANVMLESALNSLLEGRHVPAADKTTLQKEDCKVYERFWSQLQMTLKSMLTMARPGTTKKPLACSEQTASQSGDVKKLKELYMLSLKATDFTQLHAIYRLWVSENESVIQ
ncbi:hypothetical protein CTI12_AA131020 [Artemisia annua]|uniref:EDRF1 N-terminal domain-containing protein n=1 Tax=Artemisia annua TaxID=35608 RepID=A0A2U1PP20_ARTAN|nr:hypothetical protein CTI12_AA131020 [Artemisia annua]